MNDIVNRLRDATQAVGETIDHVPAFEPGASRTRKKTWLVPIAAAASVTVAVAAGAAIAQRGGNTINVAAATTAGPAAVPRFFAEARPGGITIRSVAGGAVTAQLPQPSEGEWFSSVQAAQDNRLFYAASDTEDCRSRFYQFTLDENGLIGSYGVLPFTPPEGTRPTSLGVNGDGSKLAYGLGPCTADSSTARLVITDTATGDSRTWESTDRTVVHDVSLSADGRYVLFSRATEPLLTSEPAVVQSQPSSSSVSAPAPSSVSAPAPSAVSAPAPSGATAPAPTVATATPRPDSSGDVTAAPPTPYVPEATVAAVPPSPPADEATMTFTPSPAKPPLESVPGVPAPTASTAAPAAGGEAVPPPGVPVPTRTVTVNPSTGAVVDPPSAVPVTPSAVALSVCRMSPVKGAPAEPAPPAVAPKVEPTHEEAPAVARVWVCAESPQVSLLDTSTPGDSLDQARAFTFARPYDGVSGDVFGITITPDGTRILALLSDAVAEIVNGRVKPMPGSGGLVAYATADGRPVDVLYRGATAGLRQLDVDGTGQNVIVAQAGEVGVVSGSEYRTLFKQDVRTAGLVPDAVAW